LLSCDLRNALPFLFRDNVLHIGSTFPSFRVRVYHSLTPASAHWAEMCGLACEHSHLDLCDVNNNPKYGNASLLYPLLWRYLPLMDSQVRCGRTRHLSHLHFAAACENSQYMYTSSLE
jgi:hypothetical protein